MSTPLDTFTQALDRAGCRPRRNEARCPAHEDRKPSLSFNVGDNGAVVFHCHVGCEPDAVLSALGLAWADVHPPQEENGKRHIVAEYPYTDEHGEPLYYVVRFEPKGFAQRLPGGRWGIGKTRRVPYALPIVRDAAAKAQTVWVVEGEKDAEALLQLGHAATCNSGGAGRWDDSHAAHLAGAGHVNVIADDDPPGHAHAHAVAKTLAAHGIPHTVLVSPHAKDISAHLNGGHRLEDLVPLDDTWPEPIPLVTTADLPPFPVDALPAWMADMVRHVAYHLQVPVDLPAGLGIGALAVVCTGAVRVVVAGKYREPASLYLGLVSPPGTGKSPVLKRMAGPVIELDAVIAEQSDEIARQAEVLQEIERKAAEALRDQAVKTHTDAEAARNAAAAVIAAERMDVPPRRRLLVDDATPEALTKILADHAGRVSILSTEGGIFEAMSGRYSGKLNLDVYLKAWSGDPIIVDRVKNARPQRIAEPLMSVAVTVQPAVLTALADNPALQGRGLTSRFMFSVIPDNVGYRDRRVLLQTPDAEIEERYAAELGRLGRWATSFTATVEVRLSPSAQERYVEWAQAHEDRLKEHGDLRPLAEWMPKCESSVLRLAGMLHLADGNRHDLPVSAATLERACAIGDYWTAHATVAHGLWGGDEIGRQAEAIRRRLPGLVNDEGTFTLRDLHRSMHRWFSSIHQAIPPLERLAEHGWIRSDDPAGKFTAGKGRKPVSVRVHPNLRTWMGADS